MCFLLGAFWLHDTNNYMMSYFIFCPMNEISYFTKRGLGFCLTFGPGPGLYLLTECNG